jgi:hypothetical protein
MNIIAEETYLNVLEETDELVIIEEIVKNDIIEVGSIIIREIVGDSTKTIDDQYIAGENLSGHRIAYLKDGKVWLADKADKTNAGRIIGMTLGAVIEGDIVTVRKIGKISNPGWGLTPNTLYFLHSNGEISASIPTSGFVQNIGAAIDQDTLEIRITIPILL